MPADQRSPPHTLPHEHNPTSSPPSYKRRRIALACTSCRNRKSRCNGAKPNCSLCVELGFECVYQQPATGNVRSVEPPTGYDERLRRIEDTLQILVNQKSHPHRQDLAIPNEPTANPELDSTFHDGQQVSHDDEDVAILDESDQLHHNVEDSVDGMAAITDPEETESRFFGPSSNIALLRHISDATSTALRTISQSRLSEPGIHQPIVSRVASPMTTAFSEASPNFRHNINVRSLPAENRALRLIKLFFSDTGMLFPYIHEQEILRTYSTARRNRFLAVSRSWLCLVNVIFAFSTYISANPDQSAERNAAESKVFIERAQALSADIEMKSASLETVQCLLLMAQYRQGTQRSDQAWNLHGLAVRAAIQLGLHSRTASTGLSAVESEVRKRTWFGCMIMDRTLSMTFGRPCMMLNSIVRLDSPSSLSLERLTMLGATITSSNTLHPPDTVCFFIATIQLYYVLGDIISELYGNNVDIDPGLALSTMLERTVTLEQKMASWRQHLLPQLQRRPWDAPESDSISISTWDPVFDRLSVILMLRYLNTRILLHRPILSAFLGRRGRPESTTEARLYEEGFFNDLGEKSIRTCEQSAMEIIDIVSKTSRPPALLGAWWFTAYYTFNAALVIFGCVLLEITNSRMGTSTLARTFDTTRVVSMILQLKQGTEALQPFGEGTKSAKRIRKTLVKLMQICMALVQANAEIGPAVLSGLASSQQDEVHHGISQGRKSTNLPPMTASPAPPNEMMSTFAPDDPFAVFDTGMPQYWTNNNFDLFTDLVGVEPGLTALMAG